MKRSRRAALVAVIAGTVLGLSAQAAWAAETYTVEGGTSYSGWKVWNTERIMVEGWVDFAPTNLIYQAGPVSSLNLRVHDSRRAQPGATHIPARC